MGTLAQALEDAVLPWMPSATDFVPLPGFTGHSNAGQLHRKYTGREQLPYDPSKLTRTLLASQVPRLHRQAKAWLGNDLALLVPELAGALL